MNVYPFSVFSMAKDPDLSGDMEVPLEVEDNSSPEVEDNSSPEVDLVIPRNIIHVNIDPRWFETF